MNPNTAMPDLRSGRIANLRAYARSSAIGCALACVFGLLAAQKVGAERGQSLTTSEAVPLVALAAAVGILSGLLFQVLAPLRHQGRSRYVLSWVVAVAPASAVVVLPDILLRGAAWSDLVLAASLGAGAGLGLGLFAYAFRGNDSHLGGE